MFFSQTIKLILSCAVQNTHRNKEKYLPIMQINELNKYCKTSQPFLA